MSAHQAWLEQPYDRQSRADDANDATESEACIAVRDEVLTAMIQSLAVLDKSASGANNFNDAVITTAFFTPNTGGNNAIQ